MNILGEKADPASDFDGRLVFALQPANIDMSLSVFRRIRYSQPKRKQVDDM